LSPTRLAVSALLMLRNYLLIALRNARRQPGFTAINVVGLALGLACAFFIAHFVQDECSFDRFHEKGDRIYRLVADSYTASERTYGSISSAPMGPALRAEFPEVEEVVRLFAVTPLVAYGEQRFHEERVYYADVTFFDVFDFPLLDGDPATALRDPGSIVLTPERARKYFGREEPLGETLLLGSGQQPFTVTGVLAPVPHNSHLQFDALLSHSSWEWTEENWLWFGWRTYVLLQPGHEAATLEQKLPDLVQLHAGERMERAGFWFDLRLQPLVDIYLHSDRQEAAETVVGRASTVYIFSLIALFTLLLAGVNFTNLSTARAAGRAREIGVRKSTGATRRQLSQQFLGESLLLSLLAVAGAILLILAFSAPYEGLSGKVLDLSLGAIGGYATLLIGLALVVGLLAGIYPALVLSSMRPAEVLRGSFQTSTRGTVLRKGLVVVQFAITSALLIGTAVVYSQIEYLKRASLGVDAEQLYVLDFRGDPQVRQQAEVIRASFTALPGVESASFSAVVPGRSPSNLTTDAETSSGERVASNLDTYFVDEDFFETFGIDVVAGRTFSREFATDSLAAWVVNQAALDHFGWGTADAALGKRLTRDAVDGEVIGVVEDFHTVSLHQEVRPLAMQIRPWYEHLTLRVRTEDLSRTLAAVEGMWTEMVPHRPYEAFFLDARFAAQYQVEERFGRAFGIFAFLAVMIACLGLFGLVAHAVQQRTKEIGVRKILGARVAELAALLSRDFLVLVLIAFAVAAPVAYFGMQRWLEGFAYRVTISPAAFLIAGGLVVAIALLTAGVHTVRAAMADPVKALRAE
jgi:putative ABC transport system permease protein